MKLKITGKFWKFLPYLVIIVLNTLFKRQQTLKVYKFQKPKLNKYFGLNVVFLGQGLGTLALSVCIAAVYSLRQDWM
jgi:hypothetical protein